METARQPQCFYLHLGVARNELLTISTLDPSPANMQIKFCGWRWKGFGITIEKAVYDKLVGWTEENGIPIFVSFAKRYPSGRRITKVWRIGTDTPHETKGDTVLLRAKDSVTKTK